MRKLLVFLFTAASGAMAQTSGEDIGQEIYAVDSSAPASHVCARYLDGSIVCWGTNGMGQLGQRDRVTRQWAGARGYRRIDIERGHSIIQITLGLDFTCARLDDGTVRCFGSNSSNQLGRQMVSSYGGDAGQMGRDLAPADLGNGRIALDIDAGRAHACAVLDTGAVACWGANGSGQLGYTGTLPVGTSPPALVFARPAVRVAAGDTFTCALFTDATVKCWGGGMSSPGVPFATPLGRTVRAIAAGGAMVCLILDDGRVACGTPGGLDAAFVPMASGRTGVTVDVAARGPCVLMDNGMAQCQDQMGALLNLTTWTTIDPGAGHVIVDVAGNANSVCFVREDATAARVAR